MEKPWFMIESQFFKWEKKRKNGRKNNVQGLFSKISLEAIEAENLGMLAIPGDKIAIKLVVKFGISSQSNPNLYKPPFIDNFPLPFGE